MKKKIKTMEKYDQNYKISKPHGNCATMNKGTIFECRRGSFFLKEGIVNFYSHKTHTSFEFIYKGRIYYRVLHNIKKLFSDKSLIIQAGKFGREIIKTV